MNAPASLRHLRIAGILVLSVFILGTLGYIFIEHLSFVDALYTTVNIMATIGNVVHPLTAWGRLFTLFVVVFGVGSLLYTLGSGMEFMIEGHFSRVVKGYLMENKIARLHDHSIICGFGRVGLQIATDCAAAQRLFVVIDEKESNIQKCIRYGYLALQGDATSDDMLREAGVQRAQCVLAATDSDAYNISITLSARNLNSNLFIIARANHSETEAKLKLAGADRVLPLYALGGHHMANLAFQPGVIEFFDIITKTGNMELAVREVVLGMSSPLINKTIAEAQNTLENGIILIALKKWHGLLAVPKRETLIEENDTLIVLGVPEQLARFESNAY